MGKISKKLSALLLASVMLMLTGCGEEPINLTDEERNQVISYAAHIVGKYNGMQTEGLVYIAEEPDEEGTLQEEPTDVPTEEANAPAEEPAEEQDTAEAANPEENADLAQDSAQGDTEELPTEDVAAGDTANESATDQQADAEQVSFNEALGLGDVAADYKGYDITNPYVEADYYSVTADAGKTFLVLHVDLTNNATEAMNCNILAAGPVFTATVNGGIKVAAETTILLNDLSTFSADMQVGETVSTVLLFQIPEEEAANINDLSLSVFINNTNYNISL